MELFLDCKALRSWENVEEFVEKNSEFYIWGAGSAGRSVKRFLEEKGKKVLGFLSNNWEEEKKNVENVFPPSILKEKKKPIIVSTGWFVDVAKQLINEGWKLMEDFVPFYAYEWFLSDLQVGKEFCQLCRENIDKIKKVYQCLDESSRMIYQKVINYRLNFLDVENIYEEDLPKYFSFKLFNRDRELEETISLLKEKGAYEHPVINQGKYKVILEAGAYIGDTALIFLEKYPNALIYSFEPSPDTFKILEKNVSSHPNIHPINKGLSNFSGRAKMLSNPQNPRTNKLVSSKDGDIEIISIDDFVKEENLVPDFIKLDVEGEELKVLEGARNTLEKYYPDLSIAIYHKGRDLWEIPLFIKTNFPHYNLVITHTDVFISSTRLIATIKEV